MAMVFVNELENLRTIDYERKIVLRRIHGSPRESHYQFELDCSGEKLFFGAYVKCDMVDSNKIAVHWNVDNVHLGNSSKDQRDVYALIKEALEAYGYLHRRDNVESSIVQFSKNLDRKK